MTSRRLYSLAAIAALVTGIPAILRARTTARTWGATPVEVNRALPGDSFVANPAGRSTMAITIDADPAHVWPWLVQMGKGRGGLYSYDWLDRLFRILDAPSAKQILPGWQSLETGDVIPIGKSSGFPVLAVEPFQHLVLGGGDDEWTVAWAFVLAPEADGSTRLITRYQANYPKTLRNRLVGAVLTPTAFIMTRRMLLNLRQRAEDLALDDPAP